MFSRLRSGARLRIGARARLGTRFTLLLALIFVIGMALSGAALYRQLQLMGQDWVSSNGLLLLHAMNSVRTYTANQVDPIVNPLMADGKKFIPESVPAFSARSVFGNMRGQGLPADFTYKEAALNPTAPQDRADAWETELLMRFRNDPNLHEISGFRTLNGQFMFYSARPMVVNNPACLACHTTPQTAPAALVQRYGPINGFGWKLNDIIAAQIVYAPAAEVYNRGRQTWLAIMGISMVSFALAVLAVNFALRRSVVSPISQMAELAQRISVDDVDESAPQRLAEVAKRPDELGQMARVFQRMAHEVYAREQTLRQEVQELRIEIDEAKKARQVSELVDSDSFKDLQARAHRLRDQHHGVKGDPPDSLPAPPGPPAGAPSTEQASVQAEPLVRPDQPEPGAPARQEPANREAPRAGDPQEDRTREDAPGGESPSQAHTYQGGPQQGGPSLGQEEGRVVGPAPDFDRLKEELSGLERVNGITPVEILVLPEAVRPAIKAMLQRAMPLDELAQALRLPADEARQLGDILVDKGFLQSEASGEDGMVRYSVRFARTHKHRITMDT